MEYFLPMNIVQKIISMMFFFAIQHHINYAADKPSIDDTFIIPSRYQHIDYIPFTSSFMSTTQAPLASLQALSENSQIMIGVSYMVTGLATLPEFSDSLSLLADYKTQAQKENVDNVALAASVDGLCTAAGKAQIAAGRSQIAAGALSIAAGVTEGIPIVGNVMKGVSDAMNGASTILQGKSTILNAKLSMLSPTTADVVVSINNRIDFSTSTIISSLKSSMVDLSKFMVEQTKQLEIQLADNNFKAAFRAITDDISILNALNVKAMAQKEIEEAWIYEIYPCGVEMTLCNNAFSTIAASVEDIVGAVYSKALLESQDEYLQVVAYGAYFQQLLQVSSISLTKVNTLYASTHVESFVNITDCNLYSNSAEFFQLYTKAIGVYRQISENSEYSRQDSTINYNEKISTQLMEQAMHGVQNKLLKGIAADRSLRVWQQMSYSQGNWRQLQLLPLQSIREDNSVIFMQCPQGTFLTGYVRKYWQYSCASLINTDPQQYSSTYTVSFDYLGTVGIEYNASCNAPGYYISEVISQIYQYSDRGPVQTGTRTVLVEKQSQEYQDYMSKGAQVNIVQNNIHYQQCNFACTSQTNLDVPIFKQQWSIKNPKMTLKCAKPLYLYEQSQCSLVRWYATKQIFLILDNELLNVDWHIQQRSIFIENPKIIDFDSFLLDYGPKLDNTAHVVGTYDGMYFVTQASKRPIDQDTFNTCQFSRSKISYTTTGFANLPVGTPLSILTKNFVNRVTDAKLIQDTEIFGAMATYTISFNNSNPLPPTVSFEILLTKEIPNIFTIKGCVLQSPTFSRQMLCRINTTTSIVRITGGIPNSIASQTQLHLIFDSLQNPSPQPTRFSSTILRIYADVSFQNFIENSLPQMMIPTLQCNWPCKTCSTINKDECFSCISNPFSYSSVYLYNKTCSRSCSALSYYNLTNGVRYCLQQCPLSTFNSNGQCLPCMAQCATCDNGFQCTSCNSQSNFPFMYRGNCLTSCPEGKTSIDGMCVDCSFNCQTCEGTLSNCTSCKTSYALINSTCIAQCQVGHFRIDNICAPCHLTCKSCHGPFSFQCDECYNNKSLPYLFKQYLSINSTCIEQCPTGSFSNNGKCIPCGVGCKQCNQSGCIECEQAGFRSFQLNQVSPKMCLQACPPGYFTNTTQVQSYFNCQQCSRGCITCVDQLTCASCDQSGLYPYLYNNSCQSDNPLISSMKSVRCPQGYFWQDSICQQCHSSCKECVGPSNEQCFSCNDNGTLPYLSTQSSCISVCPNGSSLLGKVCVACGSGCQKCDLNGCLECYQSYSMSPNKTCFSLCNAGIGFTASQDGSCQLCPESCLMCRDQSTCMVCDQKSLLPYLHEGVCVSDYFSPLTTSRNLGALSYSAFLNNSNYNLSFLDDISSLCVSGSVFKTFQAYNQLIVGLRSFYFDVSTVNEIFCIKLAYQTELLHNNGEASTYIWIIIIGIVVVIILICAILVGCFCLQFNQIMKILWSQFGFL